MVTLWPECVYERDPALTFFLTFVVLACRFGVLDLVLTLKRHLASPHGHDLFFFFYFWKPTEIKFFSLVTENTVRYSQKLIIGAVMIISYVSVICVRLCMCVQVKHPQDMTLNKE